MVILWSKEAREDLRLIHQYIARDSRRYATKVVQDIVARMDRVLGMPRIGRVVAEIGEENVREIGCYSWRILYELSGETIVVHAVIHARRNFTVEEFTKASPD